jgi:hypothetical protein
MSGPNNKSFASLKSAKKGSELSAIGRGLLQIEPFCLQAFIFSDEELEDTFLGLDPLTEHGCTAIFTHQSFHLYYKTNPEPILSGSKRSRTQRGNLCSIRNMSAPKDIHQIRAFLGCCQQLSHYIIKVYSIFPHKQVKN